MANNHIRKYPLSGLLHRCLLEGFTQEGQSLQTSAESVARRSVFFPALDSATPDCAWGRLSFSGDFAGECVLSVRVFASNEASILHGDALTRVNELLLDSTVPRETKERLFILAGGQQYAGAQDILLSRQRGRFLWLWLELSGEGSATLQNLRIYVPGDNFYHTLPAVYRTGDDFLARFLSVFSTMYQDFQEELDALPALLDVSNAPEFMLPVLASWMGLETDESLLSPQQLRQLLLLTPSLISRKGTRWAVETVVKLFVEGPVFLVERNLLAPDQRRGEDLYGSSPYDFTVLLSQATDERLRMRLHFLIQQFKPLRANCRIVFLSDCGGLDAFTYADINGTVLQNVPGSLGDGKALAGMTYLL